MQNSNCYTVEKLSEGVWSIGDDYSGHGPSVDIYFIVGDKKALLIDAGMSRADLPEIVRQITSLPVEMLLLHAHIDHTGACDFFEDVYMDPLEKELCCGKHPDLTGVNFNADRTRSVHPGCVFDLGGRRIEILCMYGHTPGSLVALDRENGLMFTSDSVGSGSIWLHIAHTLPLNVFHSNLVKLIDSVKDIPNLILHTGHRGQNTEVYGIRYLEDLRLLSEDVMSGKEIGRILTEPYPGRAASRGLMYDLCYNPQNL